MKSNGILISFEGPDGAGKTTVLSEVLPEIQKIKREVIFMREPGGVRIAEEIREIILDPKNIEIDPKTELLLYVAARRLLVKEKIFPNLEEGKMVILDRFIDSAVAYQGYGRGLGVEVVNWLNDFVTDGKKPDLTLYFDLDTDVALARIMNNRQDEVNRLDLERSEMHKKVRQGYLEIIEKEPERFVKIDASQPLEKVVEATLLAIKARFPEEFS